MMLDSCRMVPPFMLSPMVSTSTSQLHLHQKSIFDQPAHPTTSSHNLEREKYQKIIKNHKFCSGYIHRCTGLIMISKNVQTQTEISIWQINSEKLYCPSIYRGAANSICETKQEGLKIRASSKVWWLLNGLSWVSGAAGLWSNW